MIFPPIYVTKGTRILNITFKNFERSPKEHFEEHDSNSLSSISVKFLGFSGFND